MDTHRFDEAVEVVRNKKATVHTTATVSRELGCGYNEAAYYVRLMETKGIISPPNAVGERSILSEAA